MKNNNIINFPQRRRRPGGEWADKSNAEICEALRKIYLDRSLPFKLRCRAAIMAPYFGENVVEVMRAYA
jgi:hypothetical protein